MISSLRGTVVHVSTDQLVIEVSGVGFAVFVPSDVARSASPGEERALHTTLIVREDALTLYGFDHREDLDLFTLLLGVTGVGPKSALGVLSHLSGEQIARAVADDDDAPFRRVSGIGPKTAKLIVVQLAGKVMAPKRPAVAATDAPAAPLEHVTAALVGLGWPERTAAEAVEDVASTASAEERASVPALLRLTLAALGPAREGGARG